MTEWSGSDKQKQKRGSAFIDTCLIGKPIFIHECASDHGYSESMSVINRVNAKVALVSPANWF